MNGNHCTLRFCTAVIVLTSCASLGWLCCLLCFIRLCDRGVLLENPKEICPEFLTVGLYVWKRKSEVTAVVIDGHVWICGFSDDHTYLATLSFFLDLQPFFGMSSWHFLRTTTKDETCKQLKIYFCQSLFVSTFMPKLYGTYSSNGHIPLGVELRHCK